MTGLIANLVCAVVVAGMYYMGRDKSATTSKALWVPIIWIGLACSRSVAMWLGVGRPYGLQGSLEGNPIDATIIAALQSIGLGILLSRAKKTGSYLAVLGPLIVYSVYCLVSVAWAPFQLPAFKRWSKDLGDIIMMMIIAMEAQPLVALRRVFSRLGYFLFPYTIVVIRYTTQGRMWDNDGKMAIVGLTDNKNMLGLSAFLISLGLLWHFRWLLANRDCANRGRRLLAQGLALACGLYVLSIANSSTSKAAFLIGTIIILATQMHLFQRRPSRVHALCLALIVAGGIALFSGDTAANALGRESNLSGRTVMWQAMLPAVTNPMIGAGFDSFWTSPNAKTFHRNLERLNWFHPEEINEAHDGYIEVYLNLGWIGVALLALILVIGYWRATRAFRRDRELGCLMLAFIISGSIYSITEAAFRTLNPMWMAILLAFVTSSAVNARLIASQSDKRVPSRAPARNYWWQPLQDGNGVAVSVSSTGNSPS